MKNSKIHGNSVDFNEGVRCSKVNERFALKNILSKLKEAETSEKAALNISVVMPRLSDVEITKKAVKFN